MLQNRLRMLEQRSEAELNVLRTDVRIGAHGRVTPSEGLCASTAVELTKKWSMDTRRESLSLLARRLPSRECIMNGGASSPSLDRDLTFVDDQPMLPAKPTIG
jgi:hypothetical protein